MRHHAHTIVIALTAFLIACSLGKSESHGKWELVRSDSVSEGVPILAIQFVDKNHGWAITPGELLKFSSEGNDWKPILSNDNADRAFYSMTFVGAKKGVIVGAQKRGDGFTSLILQTTDDGVSWQERPVNVAPVKDIHIPHGLHGVSFCNGDVGWGVGDGLIVRTTDSGKTWETQRSGNAEERMFGIACTSPDRAWVVGSDGLLLRTIDGGKTWTHQEVDAKYSLVRIRFFGEDGWIFGGMARESIVLRTRDGGSTWQRQTIETSESLFDIYMNATNGWIVGSNGIILCTTNGGQSWEKQFSPTTNDLASVFFLSPREGWAGGAKRTLVHFSD
jgi:photosystem II stability/assembly factor-like uncharacterized protein